MFFQLNSNRYPRGFLDDEFDHYLGSCSANQPAKKLSKLISIYQQNLIYVQELQKWAYNIGVKLVSYAAGKKIRFHYKCTKKNWKQKLETKLFGLFQVFYLKCKQAYKF